MYVLLIYGLLSAAMPSDRNIIMTFLIWANSWLFCIDIRLYTGRLTSCFCYLQ